MLARARTNPLPVPIKTVPAPRARVSAASAYSVQRKNLGAAPDIPKRRYGTYAYQERDHIVIVARTSIIYGHIYRV